MNCNLNNSACAALSRFLIDSEIPVRKLAELAIANRTLVTNCCLSEREHAELVIFADLILECARKLVECWMIASGRAALAQEL
jgi:hypothetical protein